MKKKMLIIISSIVFVVLIALTVVLVLFLDTKSPEIVNFSPQPYDVLPGDKGYAVLSGVQTIEIEATDNIGVNAYSISIDDEVVSTSNTYEWDTTEYEDGSSHTIVLEASDIANNVISQTINVVVDNTVETAPTDILKFMSYNIWESGEALTGFNRDYRRQDSWLKVMREENPDICVLVETGLLDNGNSRKLSEVTHKLNGYFYEEAPYEGVVETGIRSSTDGEGILSRYPILNYTEIKNYKLDNGEDYYFHHSPFDICLDINGIETHVIAYHGKCCNNTGTEPAQRRNETESILNYLDDLGDVPVIWAGDFNAFSPVDTADPSLAPLGNLGDGPLTMILQPDDPTWGQYSSNVHNFTDTYRTLNPTKKGYTFGEWETQYWSRIDYILVNQHWDDGLINATAGDTEHAYEGSDHYSVDVFMSIPATAKVIEPQEDTINIISDEEDDNLSISLIKNNLYILVKRVSLFS